MNAKSEFLGFGIGLRTELYEPVIAQLPNIDWFEIRAENFMPGGLCPDEWLKPIYSRYPVSLHGTSLCIGNTEPLDEEYLSNLKKLADQIQPFWVSDHLCTTDENHGMTPLCCTEENLKHIVPRIQQAQERLQRSLLLENIPILEKKAHADMSHWEFVSEVAKRSDSYILIDINNLYATSLTQGFDVNEHLAGLPTERVKQIHMAPGAHKEYYGLTEEADTAKKTDPIMKIYQDAIKNLGLKDTMIERNDCIPPLEDLLEELNQVRSAARIALRNPTL